MFDYRMGVGYVQFTIKELQSQGFTVEAFYVFRRYNPVIAES